jgi:hypothetical protein
MPTQHAGADLESPCTNWTYSEEISYRLYVSIYIPVETSTLDTGYRHSALFLSSGRTPEHGSCISTEMTLADHENSGIVRIPVIWPMPLDVIAGSGCIILVLHLH